MAILKTCCCWNNVRKGSLACGIYTLILALMNGGIIAYNLHFLYSQSELDGYLQLTAGWFIATLVVCLCLLVTSVGLIIGVHRDSHILLIPWVVVIILMIVTDTAALIYECISFGLLSFNIIQMVIWLGLTLLNTYCILCVISQYQELCAGRGTHEYLTQQNRILYSRGLVNITQGPIVMNCPPPGEVYASVYSSSSMATSITTTVSMTPLVSTAPPDYDVAAMSLPQYHVTGVDQNPPVATHQASANASNYNESPPPVYDLAVSSSGHLVSIGAGAIREPLLTKQENPPPYLP